MSSAPPSPTRAASPSPPRRVLAGVFLVSLGVLMLQLALTRLFSATMYYHYAFMVVSLALLGSGAGGVLVYLLAPRLARVPTPRALSLAATLFALGTVFALLVVLASPLSPRAAPGRTLLVLARIYGASALPFLFAGSAVALAVTRFATHMSRLYLFDLLGASAGCLLLVPVMNLLGAVDAVVVVALVACAAGLLFASAGAGSRRILPAVVGLVVLGGLLLGRTTGALGLRSAKGLPEDGHVIFSRWNSFSRVTVWGSLERDSVLIMIDADAATVLSRDGRDLRRHAGMARSIEALAYHLRPGGRVLVIGPGGGDDVILSRLFGARRVTAVEVNPIIARDIVQSEPFRSYSGDLFRAPGVELVVDEGRSFIRRSSERWDVIQGTKVDTWAATAAGAYSLTENSLYTVEAFEDDLAHLDRDGLLSLTRWYTEPPDQLLRLCSLALEALRRLGVPSPERHLVVARAATEPNTARAPATFLLKKSPFSDAELARLEAVAARDGFELLYTPRIRPPNDFTRLVTAADPAEVWRVHPTDIGPTWDDRPFFFQTVRLGDLGRLLSAGAEWRKTNLGTLVLAGVLALSGLLTIVLILGPLAVSRPGALAGKTRAKLLWLLGFACLGGGYILVEISLIQKCILFLGHPVYALAVVLFSLLGWSGLGSGLSGRIPDPPRPVALRTALLVVAGLTLAEVLTLSPLFHALVGLARPWRIAVSVALIAPLGLAMGFPMPLGVRLLAARAKELVPWAWGVNGAASVVGSAGALTVAILAGFDTALVAAAGLYLAALVTLGAAARVLGPPVFGKP